MMNIEQLAQKLKELISRGNSSDMVRLFGIAYSDTLRKFKDEQLTEIANKADLTGRGGGKGTHYMSFFVIKRKKRYKN